MTYQELLKSLSEVEGMAEFAAIFELPDATFDAIYPSLSEELIKQMNAPENRKLFAEARQSEEFKEIEKVLPEVIKEIKEIPNFNKNKINFLITLLSIFSGESYDAIISIEIEENATCPTYIHLTDAGADVYAKQEITIERNSFGTVVPTGLKVAIPSGWMLSVRPRSGLSKQTGLRISNSPGTIDTGYRNEIGIIVDNISDVNYSIKKGDRIAQLVLEKAYKAKWDIVADVKNIGEDRGGGFGSTGK